VFQNEAYRVNRKRKKTWAHVSVCLRLVLVW